MAVLVFALAATFSLATAYPSHPSPRATSLFPAGISWDILLNTGGDTSSVEGVVDDNFQVIDIDLFDTSAQTIAGLKASKRVICYFSAGTREAWRSDASKFRNGDTGGAVGGGPNGDWPDEVWVDVTSANVRAIMRERIVKAAQAGCDAVDPDNVDGFVSSFQSPHIFLLPSPVCILTRFRHRTMTPASITLKVHTSSTSSLWQKSPERTSSPLG
jgi:hypothetical protein